MSWDRLWTNPPRILFADDEPELQEVVAYAFRANGFHVDCVRDGEEVLDAALARHYDAVIVELELPRLSGSAVCRQIRKRSNVPIVVLTVRNTELDRVVSLEAGADLFVPKPFSVAGLVAEVRALIPS